jgi:thioredoxin reductase (NADPH)
MLYDVIIVGAGPAAYTASIYASRYKLKNLVIGKEPGGQINEAHLIENYPGFSSVTGAELMEKFKQHVEKFKPDLNFSEVRGIKKEEDGTFTVVDESKKSYKSKAVILATGMTYRKLEIPGEEEFIGKGVSFCFVCDGMFFKDKTVAVIGGGDSAAMGASYLASVGKKVYLVFRKDTLTAEPFWQDKIKESKNIELIPNTNIKEIKGDQLVKEVVLDNPYQGQNSLETQGVFVEIGSLPSLALAKALGVEVDKRGYIKIKEDQSTNIEGVFAAGDITNGSNKFRQVVVASAEGSIAASATFKFLQKK